MAEKREEAKFAESVKKMTVDELGVELKNLRDKLYTMRSQAVTEKVENTSHFGMVRRNIARLLTEQTARRIKSAGSPRTPAASPVKKAAKPAAAKKPAKHAVSAAGKSAQKARTPRTPAKKTAKA